jgi:hypothetical protein
MHSDHEERLTEIPRGPRRLKATEHFAFAPMYSLSHSALLLSAREAKTSLANWDTLRNA